MMVLRNVTKRYGEKCVLDRFSLEIPTEGITCLFGPSGSGKTTLLRLATGLEEPDGGRVEGYKELRIAHVFQQDRLLGHLSAADNVEIAAPGGAHWLAEVGLAGEEHTRADTLSGGMQRRVAIARALAFGGDLLALDEPLRGIDMATKERIIALLRADAAIGALLITHDPREAVVISHRILRFTGVPLALLECFDVPEDTAGKEALIQKLEGDVQERDG